MQDPKFEHDCTRCVFLGHYEGADLYYCDGEPTIIARFSSDGPDYRSGLVFGERHDLKERPGDHLRVAYLIAQDMGFEVDETAALEKRERARKAGAMKDEKTDARSS